MTRLTRALALAGAFVASGSALGEAVDICFNYGCRDVASIRFDPDVLGEVGRLFDGVASPAAERAAVAQALGAFSLQAALQSPTWRDRGGNLDDDEVDGRMDCIDHSRNTSAYLALLERKGWLRFHAVGDRVQRGWIFTVHWGAQLSEPDGARWVVDTWFHDPGADAVIYPLERWLAGARPPGTGPLRF